jgi:hypothetical protein
VNRELFKQFILEHVKSAEEAEEIVRYLPAVNWRAAWSETVAIQKEVMRDGDHYACSVNGQHGGSRGASAPCCNEARDLCTKMNGSVQRMQPSRFRVRGM